MSDDNAVTRQDDLAALDAIQECVAAGGSVAPDDLKEAMRAIEYNHGSTVLRGARLHALIAASDAMSALVEAGAERVHAARACSIEAFMAAIFLTLATKRLEGEPFSPARLALYVFHLSKGMADSEPWSETLELAGMVAEGQPGIAAEASASLKAEIGTSKAIELITAERWRQVTDEGWSRDHDDEVNAGGELARAASAYALAGCGDLPGFEGEWPVAWGRRAAPKTPDRALAIAGALIVAELERLQRRAQSIEVAAFDAETDALRRAAGEGA